MAVKLAEGPAATVSDNAGAADDETEEFLITVKDDEGDGDSDADGGASDQPGSGDDGTQPKGSTEPQTAADWVDILRANPKRLSNIPGKLREEVITTAFGAIEGEVQEAARLAMPIVHKQGYDAGYEAALKDLRYEELKAMTSAERQAEFDESPAEARVYFDRQEAEKHPAPESDPRLQTIGKKLQEYPEALAILRAQEQERGKGFTDIEELNEAVIDAIAEVKSANRNGKTGNAAEAARAKSREEAAAARASVPRAEVTVGAGERQVVLTKARLAAMTPQQVMALNKTPEGKAAVNRVLAKG